jgi:hypothetical protein
MVIKMRLLPPGLASSKRLLDPPAEHHEGRS